MLPLMVAAAMPLWVANHPGKAAAAAAYDALAAPAHDAVYYRYVWWPPGWDRPGLVTRGHAAALSDRGPFPDPVRVVPGLWRIDARQVGWDRKRKNGALTGLQVWEKFAPFNFTFLGEWQFLEDAKVTVYFPPGSYDSDKGGKAWYGPTKEVQLFKAGQSHFMPHERVNPLVDVGPTPPSADHPKGGPAAASTAYEVLKARTSSETPLVSGPWWLSRTYRQIDLDNVDNGVGYYNWFGIKNRDDYFDLIGLDAKVAREKFTELREVIKRSGISNQSRVVGRLHGPTGEVTFTLDFKSQKGRGQPLRNLLVGEADHDAEEWIAPLPNGMPVHALVAAKSDAAAKVKAGDLQAVAPGFVGGDRSPTNVTNDLQIQINSCWNCHSLNAGKDHIIDLNVPWARSRFKRGDARLEDKSEEVKEELKSLYLRDLDRHFTNARRGFDWTIRSMTRNPLDPKDAGLSVAQWAKLYTGTYYGYVWPAEGVTAEAAAAELGVSKERLIAQLRKYNDKAFGRGLSDNILSAYIRATPEMVTRLEWEDSYVLAAVIADGYWPPELVIHAKGFDASVKKSLQERKP